MKRRWSGLWLALGLAGCAGVWQGCEDASPSEGLAANNHSAVNNSAPADAVPPVVEFVAPAEGAVVRAPVEVTLAATDDVGVASVELLVDGAPAASLSAPPWVWRWDALGAAPGPHRVEAVARDEAGNQASASRLLNLAAPCEGPDCEEPDDKHPPLRFEAPEAGTWLTGLVAVSLGVEGEPSEGAEVVLEASGAELGRASQGPPYGFSWDTSAGPEGEIELVGRYADEEGEPEAQVARRVVRVDRTAPSVALARPGTEDVVQGAVSYDFDITEAGELVGVELLVDGALARPLDAQAAQSGELDVQALPSGAHVLGVRATDRVGLVGQDEREFIVDRAPTAAMESPAPGAQVWGEVVIRAALADDLGLGQALVYLNGLPLGELNEAGELLWDARTPGPAVLRVVAHDSRGQQAEASVEVEVAPPAVEVVLLGCQPGCEPLASGAQVSGSLGLRAELGGEGRAVEGVRYEVNGAPVGASSQAPFEVAWDTTALEDGPATVRALLVSEGQPLEASVTLQVNNCDLDGDGARADTPACGGADCDDARRDTSPSAPDRAGDGADQNCDGLDGVDADADGVASAGSGGADCDDDDANTHPCPGDPANYCASRLSDDLHCGRCGEPCADGETCEAGQCACQVPGGCVPGDPSAYDVSGSESWVSQLQVATSANDGADLDGDGTPDNTFGPTLAGLGDLFGADLNTGIQFLINNNGLNLGVAWGGLPSGAPADASGLTVDFLDLLDADNNPRTRDRFRVARATFVEGTQTPRVRFAGVDLSAGRVADAQGPLFRFKIPLGSAVMNVDVVGARFGATLTRDALGVAVRQGQVAGAVPVQVFYDGFNALAASPQCACLSLSEPLIDPRRGAGGRACLRNVDTSRCPSGNDPCRSLVDFCSFIVPGLASQTDIDTDGDGRPDAFSAFLRWEAQGTDLTSVEAP